MDEKLYAIPESLLVQTIQFMSGLSLNRPPGAVREDLCQKLEVLKTISVAPKETSDE